MCQAECNSLNDKIVGYFKGSPFSSSVYGIRDAGNTFNRSEAVLGIGRAFFSLHSYQSIRKCRKVLRQAKKKMKKSGNRVDFACTFDECDAIAAGSSDDAERREEQMKKLVATGPQVRTYVTATPIPTIIRFMLDGTEFEDFRIKPTSDYVGVDSLQPLIVEGKEVFLDTSTLKDGVLKKFGSIFANKSQSFRTLFTGDKICPAAQFPLARKNKKIPYWNDDCFNMLDDMFEDTEMTNILAIVSTCPWVTKQGNVFQQGSFLQEWYYAMGKEFVTIVVHETKAYCRFPGHRLGFKVQTGKSISDILDKLYEWYNSPRMPPIVIFGYHKVERSISYRGSHHFPTHVITFPGKGQSNEQVVQNLGRCTGNALKLLRKNTGAFTPRIKVLAPKDCVFLAQHHGTVVEYFLASLKKNKCPHEMLREMTEDVRKYFAETSRKTGVSDLYAKLQKFDHAECLRRRSDAEDAMLDASTTLTECAGTKRSAASDEALEYETPCKLAKAA
ncbi:MAG: hypothetical protein SGILL_006088 [Bacillariaceae sp.]